MPNPWVILGGVLLLFGLLFGAEQYGHTQGVNTQKVADQVEFDRINAALTMQKSDAAAMLQKAQTDIITLQANRDKLKLTMEKQHAQDQVTNAALRDKYSGLGLRFKPAEGSGCGNGGSGTLPAQGNAAVLAAAPSVLISRETSDALRALAYDADELAANYKLCYAATQIN